MWGVSGILPIYSGNRQIQRPTTPRTQPAPQTARSQKTRFGQGVDVKKALEQFQTLTKRIWSLDQAVSLLGWDMYTLMPKAAYNVRPEQTANLSAMSHELFTSDTMKQLLSTLGQPDVLKTLPKREQLLVRHYQDALEDAQKLSPEFVETLTKTGDEGYALWEEAFEGHGDFSKFEAKLAALVDLYQQKIDLIGVPEGGSRYDVLLDDYDEGVTVKDLDPVFADLKKQLLPLIKAIQKSPVPQPDNRFQFRHYPEAKQFEFINQVLKDLGYDFNAGRQDTTTHPFMSSAGSPYDVRLATTIKENDAFWGLYSSIHEAGHGIYEQGIDPELAGTDLAQGASSGIHESQSRMMENMVARSNAFWQHYFPKFQEIFPAQTQGTIGQWLPGGLGKKLPEALGGVSFENFMRVINTVKPTLKRLEADEVTYNLHIILRYEIERDLFEKKITTQDIPRIWGEKMQEYLGLTPTDGKTGMHQDSHWSAGMFGYFPTYTLGNLAAAQLYRAAEKDINARLGPDALNRQIASGNFKALKSWLNRHVHRVGATENFNEIIQRATGESLNAQYFMDYLWQKFTPIYQLDEARQRPAK